VEVFIDPGQPKPTRTAQGLRRPRFSFFRFSCQRAASQDASRRPPTKQIRSRPGGLAANQLTAKMPHQRASKWPAVREPVYRDTHRPCQTGFSNSLHLSADASHARPNCFFRLTGRLAAPRQAPEIAPCSAVSVALQRKRPTDDSPLCVVFASRKQDFSVSLLDKRRR
ncbi:hypothetical protein NK718_16570, partial [Alsobacter sp. SYSU M60028]